MKFLSIKWPKTKKGELFLLFLIFSLAAYFRYFQIGKLAFFSYDQARDALIAKRILVDHELTLLGPQSSMPGVYLPPFYYYTLAPVLWLSGLNPAGIDIYTAAIGLLTVSGVWLVAREFFGPVPALMASALYATSPLVVEFSRQAWNPNTQPFFVLMMIFFLYRLFLTKKSFYLILAAAFFGYGINLHYGVLSLVPLLVYTFVWFLIKTKKKSAILAAILVLFLFVSPLVFFDWRHQGMLTRNVGKHFFGPKQTNLPLQESISPLKSIFSLFAFLLSGSFWKNTQKLPASPQAANRFFSPVSLSVVAHRPLLIEYQWWGAVLLVFIAFFLFQSFFIMKKKENGRKLALFLLVGAVLSCLLVSQFYGGKFYFFYFSFLFPWPFLLFGFYLWSFWPRKWGRLLGLIIFLAMFYFNLHHFLPRELPTRTISDLHLVSRTIAADIDPSLTFNLAADLQNPDRWDHNAVDYRYFVETFYNQRSLDWQPEDFARAEVLYFIRYGKMADPVNSPIMEVQEFRPKLVLKTWELPGDVVIYKLVKSSEF